MAFDVPGSWVWDFWTTYDETTSLHHLFFLHAPRSLGDPDLRHRNARIGHATSPDLRSWTRVADPFPQPRQGFDDLAFWTGSVARSGGRWWMFTTGVRARDDTEVQRIGSAWSDDLLEWHRTSLLLEPDPRWYETFPASPAQAWRDPWVVRGADGTWHLYITARDARRGPGSGVVGHAVSEDLTSWEVRPPLSEPDGVLDQQEVTSLVEVEGRWVVLFSCLATEMQGAAPGSGGVWCVPVDGPGSQVDVAAAVRLTDERLYVGKIVHLDAGAHLMAFDNVDPQGAFIGGLTDPLPVRWRADGRGLELVEEG